MWNELISMENLLLAYKKASKNRRSRQEVANFEFELERNLFQIRDKLEDGSYHHNSPSLGGDAETSEVSRHGTQNLFSKASFFRFALRPRHAFCPHFTQSRRGRRDKRGFPSRHPQFIQKSVLISLRMASSPCVSSKSESSRHGKQTS